MNNPSLDISNQRWGRHVSRLPEWEFYFEREVVLENRCLDYMTTKVYFSFHRRIETVPKLNKYVPFKTLPTFGKWLQCEPVLSSRSLLSNSQQCSIMCTGGGLVKCCLMKVGLACWDRRKASRVYFMEWIHDCSIRFINLERWSQETQKLRDFTINVPPRIKNLNNKAIPNLNNLLEMKYYFVNSFE